MIDWLIGWWMVDGGWLVATGPPPIHTRRVQSPPPMPMSQPMNGSQPPLLGQPHPRRPTYVPPPQQEEECVIL